MHDAGKVVPGLALFLALATAPFWYAVARGQDARAPELEKPRAADRCVMDAERMRSEHMQLLAGWRDDVVRSGERLYVASDGRRFEKSLTRTCLGCHENRAAHCDRCHGYLDVSPYCWDCHVDPKGAH